jgi:glycosyltransferase involved in cell wall biosynthesis
MKRILIISPCPGEGAGAEVVLEELLRAWAAPELQLVLMAPEGSRIHRIALERNFEWYDLPVKKNGLYLRDNLRAVKAACETVLKCDRVHAWTIRAFPAAEWLGRKWGVPVSGTLHDNPFPRKIHGPVLWDMRRMNFRSIRDWREMVWCTQELVLRTWWRWQWAQRAAGRFEKLICVSEAVKQECIKKGYRCPLTVIRNGLAGFPVPERVSDDKVRIGFLGMEYPQRKGFSVVEQWIPMLGNQVVWNLYGAASGRTLKRLKTGNQRSEVRGQKTEDRSQRTEGGGQRSEVRQGQTGNFSAFGRSAGCGNDFNEHGDATISTSGTPRLFEYMGDCPREKIYREIDVLVHASTLFDPLPTVLIEAARAGIPCIASSSGGAGEIVEDGVSGFIFDPKCPEEGQEKLKSLLDPELRRRMGKKARERFETQFRVERMAAEYGRTLN